MGWSKTMKDLLGKGQKYAVENSDKVEDAINKAGQFANKQTGGKYTQHIGKAQAAAKKAIPKDQPPTR